MIVEPKYQGDSASLKMSFQPFHKSAGWNNPISVQVRLKCGLV
jgi:hypothetical protein